MDASALTAGVFLNLSDLFIQRDSSPSMNMSANDAASNRYQRMLIGHPSKD